MFASWNKARNASLVAAAVGASLLVAPPNAQALEGVQGRHAIFYPSLELVYQHDDNFFLKPSNEISADMFIARAHFPVEIPGARQYLRFEYVPQYRNVSLSQGSYDLDRSVSHFWELDARLRGSAIFSVDISQDLTLGVLEVADLDDNREFNKGAGESFLKHDIYADFRWEGSQQGATLKVGNKNTSFDDIAAAPAWFELDERRIGTEYFYKFTPLTNFNMGFMYYDSSQDYTPATRANNGNVWTLDSTKMELYFGFRGELGRTTTGSASVGFVNLDYDGNAPGDEDFDGIWTRADLTKAFSRYSKLAFNVERRPNFSAYDINTYYVNNRVSATFTNQPRGGRVFWTVDGAFQRNNYDTPTLDGTTLALREREDDIVHMRAEVAYHPIEHLSLRLNYRFEERESNHDTFDYTDNLVIFQVQFGF